MTSINIPKLLLEIDESIDFYSEQLTLLRILIHKIETIDPALKQENFKEIILLNNFNSILIISILDLLVISKCILTFKTQWDKIYYIKNEYLTIYETIKSIEKSNKDIYNLISKKYYNQKYNYNRIKLNLKEFKSCNRYEEELYQIRNKVGGHIEPNLKIYYDIILKMNGDEAVKAITDFNKILIDFFNFTKDLAVQGNLKLKEENSQINRELKENLKKFNP